MKRFPFLQTMRARLMFWNMFVLTLALLALGGILSVSVEHNIMASVDNAIVHKAQGYKDFFLMIPPEKYHPRRPHGRRSRRGQAQAADADRKNATQETSTGASTQNANAKARWRTPIIERVFDLKGNQTWPDEGEVPWARIAFVRASEGQEGYSTIQDEDERVRVFSAPLRLKSGQIVEVVQVGYSLADMERTLDNLHHTLRMLIPVALAVASLGGLFLTGRMLQPLRDVTHAAARIGAEDLSQRLHVRGQDEFSQLATTFNAMLRRLELSFEQQRRFTADASHELRTPLTVIKANSSLALSDPNLPAKQKRAWEATDRAASLMSAIIQDLLLLARSDAGQLILDMRSVSLRDAVEAAREAIQVSSRIVITNSIPNSLVVSGDITHLTRLFANLLKNAVRYTPEDGQLSIAAKERGDTVIAAVADTGAGIAPEHLPHVLERFYRVDAARSRADGGTGLGLAICKSIAEAHGGELHIESALGEGTTVFITLRRAEDGYKNVPASVAFGHPGAGPLDFVHSPASRTPEAAETEA